ncbi:LINE-1 retrotransposable element ORF1 protein [Liparis tanakae]|uniref:LINE-1 retrotransposable element ORF1 protein n=1 Tax=Liparis tanakae TaxID=230148 RepID=A0A4Z2HAU2_9TELE|nr:LINE-1 retrotransposable element ORF1 protein [Liparis tanakae]
MDLISRLDASTKTINKAVGEVNIKLEMLGEQITEVQQRVCCNEDNIEDLKTCISHIEKENGILKQKADSMENYIRRSNIRMVKVPEKAEGQDIIGFVQQLILHLFGQENFPHPPLIERAHRSPTQRSDNTSSFNPRPILGESRLVMEVGRYWTNPTPSDYRGFPRYHLWSSRNPGQVLKRVKQPIKQIRKGLKETGIWPLISDRLDVHPIIFPRESHEELYPQAVIQNIHWPQPTSDEEEEDDPVPFDKVSS